MSTLIKQKKETIKIKQYITDDLGRKVAAVIDFKELNRIGELLEDRSDIKAIRYRISEPAEDYEAYRRGLE
jgi:hypothetical protein